MYFLAVRSLFGFPLPPMGTEAKANAATSSATAKLAYVHRAIMAPFGHKSTDSTRILSDCTASSPSE